MATVNTARAGLSATSAVNGSRANFSSGGYTPRGNVGALIAHNAGIGTTGFTAGFSVHTPFFTDGQFLRARGLRWGVNTSTSYPYSGMAAAPSTGVASRVVPTGAAVQLTFAGIAAHTIPLASLVTSQIQPNYLLGDWVSCVAVAPVVDATNNPKGSYVLMVADESNGTAVHGSAAPSTIAVQNTALGQVNGTELGIRRNTYFRTFTGAGIQATAFTGTAPSEWTGGFVAAYGVLLDCTRPVINVALAADSLGEGAWSNNNNSGYEHPYFLNAVLKASTLRVPMFAINLARSGLDEDIFCETVDRWIDQVLMPDVLVVQPSRNSSWGKIARSVTLAARVRNAGGWVIWLTPLPDGSATAAPSAWHTARATVLSQASLERTIVVDCAAALGMTNSAFNAWQPRTAANMGLATGTASPVVGTTYGDDGIHLNAHGHAVLRDALAAALSTIARQVP